VAASALLQSVTNRRNTPRGGGYLKLPRYQEADRGGGTIYDETERRRGKKRGSLKLPKKGSQGKYESLPGEINVPCGKEAVRFAVQGPGKKVTMLPRGNRNRGFVAAGWCIKGRCKYQGKGRGRNSKLTAERTREKQGADRKGKQSAVT